MRCKLILLFILIAAGTIGCTSITPINNPVIQDVSRLSCSISELDKFMAFGVHFATLSDKEKKIECNQLRFNYSILNDLNAGWSLAYAINNYAACGTKNEGISILKNIRDTKLNSEQIEWLINYQIVLLKQLKTIEYQHKKKIILNQALILSEEQLSNCQAETNTMTLKLHELKSIETSINQRLEDNQQ